MSDDRKPKPGGMTAKERRAAVERFREARKNWKPIGMTTVEILELVRESPRSWRSASSER